MPGRPYNPDTDPDRLAQMTQDGDHSHPVYRMTWGVSLSTYHPNSDYDDDSVHHSHHWHDGVGLDRLRPMQMALGAGFDRCSDCTSRHAVEVAKDPLLLVWLAYAIGLQVGKWQSLSKGRDPQRWRYFAARLDADAANVVDALYSGGDDGLNESLKAARALSEDRRAIAVKIMIDMIFLHINMMDIAVGFGELRMLDSGAKLDWLDQAGAFGWTAPAAEESGNRPLDE
jgi:hypothetical protein